VSAILIHDTLRTTFSLSDAVINEAPWQCASLKYDHLLQLINGVKLPAVIHWHLSLIGQGWTNARGLRCLGCPKPDPIIQLELFSPENYVVTCESVHVITCCMLPYIHFCVFT